MHPWKLIALWTLLAQLMMIFFVYLIFVAVNGYSGTIFQRYSTIFMQQNAYGIGLLAHNAGSELALIPIIPWIMKLFSMLGLAEKGISTILIFIMNSIVVSADCVLLYEVLLLDCDRDTSARSLLLLFISPIILFMLMPLSGTAELFFFSLLFLYFMKTARPAWGLGCMIAAIAFNILAVLLLIPFIMLCIKLIVKKRRENAAVPIVSLCAGIVIVGGFIVLSASGIISTHAASLLYQNGFRWFFEGMTAAVMRWNSSPSSALAMFFAVGAQVAALLVSALCARRVDAATGALMLCWLALVPMAFSDPSMAVYSVCVCPALPILLAVSTGKRTARLVLVLFMLVVFIVFTSTVFAYRIVI